MANITGKTISELPLLSGFTNDTLFPVELSGSTYHIPYSSITNYENIIYSDLYNKVVNGLLETDKWYRLTDYKSVNFLNGWDIARSNPTPIEPSFNPREIYTGDTEVLLLQATSPYDISEIGYSETFNGDIIQYQPYTNKIGTDLEIYNGNTLPDSSTVSGFDLQWDGTNVYFEMPSGYPALFGHYFYLYCEFNDGVDSYYQDGNFEPLTPGISICQYPYTSDDPDNGYPKAMSRLKVVNNGTKVILLDLDQSDFNNYVLDSLYINSVYALGDAYGWITRRNDTHRNINVPFDFRGRKYRRYEVDLSLVNTSLGTGFYGQGDNYLGYGTTGNYRDFYSFNKDYYDIYDVMWEGMGGADQWWYAGYSDNNVFFDGLFRTSLNDYSFNNTLGYCNTNNIGYGFYNNIILSSYLNNIGNFFSSNLIGYSFDLNNIGENVFNNKIRNNFSSNNIGHSFYNNVISGNFTQNTTNSNFINNIIGSDFSVNKIERNFYTNNIGNLFYQNYVGNNFLNNQVGSECKFNNFNESFYNNNLSPNFFQRNVFSYSVNGIDFSSATHVYNDYTCEVFKNSGGALRLSYYDGFDVLNITNINS